MRLLPVLVLLLAGCRKPPTSVIPDNDWPPILDTWADYEGEGAQEGELLAGFLLPDQQGDAVDSRQFLGFVVALQLGTTFCDPCQDFALEQQALHARVRAEHSAWVLTVLGQSPTGGPPDPGDAAAWAAQFGLEMPVLADIALAQQQAWSITRWPTTLVVAPDGTVLHRHEDPVSVDRLESEIADAAAAYVDLLRDR